jgi:hypothetical protein
MGRIWSSIVACTVSVCGVAFSTAPVVAQNDGFIFSGDKAVSARDPRQFIAAGEKLSISQLKQRFPSYTVTPEEGDCGGTCASIEGKSGARIYISYGGDSNFSFSNISSDARSSRDILGNAIGTPLRKAIGANIAKCDLGESMTCLSAQIKGLSYIAVGCTWKGETIPACAKVGGFEISR